MYPGLTDEACEAAMEVLVQDRESDAEMALVAGVHSSALAEGGRAGRAGETRTGPGQSPPLLRQTPRAEGERRVGRYWVAIGDATRRRRRPDSAVRRRRRLKTLASSRFGRDGSGTAGSSSETVTRPADATGRAPPPLAEDAGKR